MNSDYITHVSPGEGERILAELEEAPKALSPSLAEALELNRVQSITLHNSAPEQSQIAYLMSSLIAQPHRAKEFVEILRREKADHPALTDIADAIERAFEHITKLVTVNRARYDILMEVARDLYENPTIDRYVGVCLFDALESLYYSVSGPTKVDRQFPNWVRE